MLKSTTIWPRRNKRRSRKPASNEAPASGPNLIAANYSEGDYVELTFDQPINIDDLDPGQIIVNDGTLSAETFQGTSPFTQPTPSSVRVSLVDVQPYTPDEITLTADSSTGIRSESTQSIWQGVTDLALPFGD